MLLQEKLQSLLETQTRDRLIYGALLKVQTKDGAVDIAGATGLADKTTSTPMTTDTPYYLASATKLYTTAAIMQLHEKRMLDIEQPIAAYLPAAMVDGLHMYRGHDYSREVRVRHLLEQSSGIPDYFDGKPKGGRSVLEDLSVGQDRPLDLNEALALSRVQQPKFAPGKKGHYSDTNYQLLGAIVEAVSGQGLRAYFESAIIHPLGLRTTWLSDPAQAAERPVSAPLYAGERQLNIPQFMAFSAPDGGMISTLDDSMTFIRAFFEGRLFDAALLPRLTAAYRRIFFPMEYGTGIMRFRLPRFLSPFAPAPELIGHSGISGAIMFYNPERGVYIVGTTNQLNRRSKPFQLMLRVINLIASR